VIVMLAFIVPLLLASVAPAAAATPDSLVPEIEQRLAAQSADTVNAYLAGDWVSAMLPLNRRAAACELRAVKLAVRLSRSTNARAAHAHVDSLREAIGTCLVYVLTLATREEIPRYCSSVASWSVMHTVRELRRRIAAIEADDLLSASTIGKSCRAAYIHELENTRVIVKSSSRPLRPAP
jgi:hypothetical protein